MKPLAITSSTLTTGLGAGRAVTLAGLKAGHTGLAPARFMNVALPTWTGEVPEALNDLVMACLAKDAAGRPQTALALHDKLEAIG